MTYENLNNKLDNGILILKNIVEKYKSQNKTADEAFIEIKEKIKDMQFKEHTSIKFTNIKIKGLTSRR